MESFKSPSFIYEGFFGMFLVISYVMLLHVLIAVLNYEYEMRIKRMDSEYTAVLIAHLDK